MRMVRDPARVPLRPRMKVLPTLQQPQSLSSAEHPFPLPKRSDDALGLSPIHLGSQYGGSTQISGLNPNKQRTIECKGKSELAGRVDNSKLMGNLRASSVTHRNLKQHVLPLSISGLPLATAPHLAYPRDPTTHPRINLNVCCRSLQDLLVQFQGEDPINLGEYETPYRRMAALADITQNLRKLTLEEVEVVIAAVSHRVAAGECVQEWAFMDDSQTRGPDTMAANLQVLQGWRDFFIEMEKLAVTGGFRRITPADGEQQGTDTSPNVIETPPLYVSSPLLFAKVLTLMARVQLLDIEGWYSPSVHEPTGNLWSWDRRRTVHVPSHPGQEILRTLAVEIAGVNGGFNDFPTSTLVDVWCAISALHKDGMPPSDIFNPLLTELERRFHANERLNSLAVDEDDYAPYNNETEDTANWERDFPGRSTEYTSESESVSEETGGVDGHGPVEPIDAARTLLASVACGITFHGICSHTPVLQLAAASASPEFFFAAARLRPVPWLEVDSAFAVLDATLQLSEDTSDVAQTDEPRATRIDALRGYMECLMAHSDKKYAVNRATSGQVTRRILEHIFAEVPELNPTVDMADIDSADDGAFVASFEGFDISSPSSVKVALPSLDDLKTLSAADEDGSLARLDSVLVMHSSAIVQHPASLRSALDDVRSGRIGIVVPISTLYEVYREMAATGQVAHLSSKAAKKSLQILRYELAQQNVILASVEDELQLRSLRNYTCPDLMPWNVAIEIRKKAPRTIPSVVASTASRAWCPWNHITGGVDLPDVMYEDGMSHKFHSTLKNVRSHQGIQFQELDEMLTLSDITRYVLRVDASKYTVKDSYNPKFTNKLDASNRSSLHHFQNITPKIDQKHSPLSQQPWGEGMSRGNSGNNLTHIGVYTPLHPQR